MFKGMLIGFLIIIIPIVIVYFSSKQLKEWLEENVNKMVLFDISIIIFFVGLRANSYLETRAERINETNVYTIEYLFKNIVSNGLLTVLVLFLIGLVTRNIYKGVSHILNLKKENLKEGHVEIIFMFALLTCILFNISVDGWESMSYLLIFSILLGKFVWLDTTKDKFITAITDLFMQSPSTTIIGMLMFIVVGVFIFIPITIRRSTAIGLLIGGILAMIILTVLAIQKSKNK